MFRRLRAHPTVGRLALVAVLIAGAPAAVAAAPTPSKPGASVRLVVAGVVDGRPELGIEIALEPGWKTYWRTPGDAGIPPVVDWSKSTGASAFDLRFPAPVRFGEEGVTSIGYTGPVVLPIDLALADPAKPAKLDLDVQIGLCGEICVPVSTHLSGTVAPDMAVDAATLARLREARSRLPTPAVRGTAPWVMSLERDRDRDSIAGAVLVRVKTPDGGAAAEPRDVLVEGPTSDWALPVPTRVGGEPGSEVWRFELDGIPRDAKLEGAELRFTLRLGDLVVEQKVTLDAAVAKP
jgi:DsbC/DsbD-like thiol-disulfide interchange protein